MKLFIIILMKFYVEGNFLYIEIFVMNVNRINVKINVFIWNIVVYRIVLKNLLLDYLNIWISFFFWDWVFFFNNMICILKLFFVCCF